MILDPLRPYLGAIKALAYLAIVAAAFIGGCNHGEANGAKDVAEAQAGEDRAVQAAASMKAAMEAVNRETDRAKAEATRQARQAEEAAKRAAASARALADKQVAIDAAIEQAKRDPDCRAMMERKTCALLR